MDIAKTYHGFTLVKKEKITSISSVVHLFKHKKTGAELLYVKNKDPELLYTVAFRTPADDDTGKPHIFEHATMMSSEKYPVRDAFIGLYRSAHTSFLNAMTFPDKTVYPVGSTNKKEFRKLVDVYTDTAFKPKIHEEKNIFLQEGVRFEIGKKDNLSLNGVVFNEMKGALSSPDRQLEEQAMNLLFPDNTYQYCSGGLPEKIPTLSFEELTEYHTRCYHPSNAHFFFYGDISIGGYLKYLDDEYLSGYKKTKPQKIKKQQNKNLRDVTREYTSVGVYEQHSYGFKLLPNKREEERIAAELLMELLMGDAQAPLKKELIASGIAQDYEHLFEDEIQDMFALFFAKNAKKGSGKEFKKLIYKTLKKLSEEGFTEEQITKVVTRNELLRKAAQESTGQGLSLFRLAETAWLYGGDPVRRLTETEIFLANKKTYTNTFFKKLIKKLFLENEHANLFTLVPTKKDLQKEAIEKLLARETKKLTNKKKEQLRSEMKGFVEWQKYGADNFKDFFPVLPLKEIPEKEVYAVTPKVSKKKSVTYVWGKTSKEKLAHTDIWFDISHVSYKDMPYVQLLIRTLVESSTTEYSAQEVAHNIGSFTTGVQFAINGVDNKKGEPHVYLQLSFACLHKKQKQVVDLVRSMLSNSNLDESRLSEVLGREIASMESGLVGMGARGFAQTRTFAKLYAHGTYEEYARGITYLKSLREIKKETGSVVKMRKIYRNLFTTKGAYVTGLSNSNNLDKQFQILELPDVVYGKKKVSKLPRKNELVLSESMSNYNSYGFKVTPNLSVAQQAARSVLATILNPNYLWKKLRDAGGAYGGALMPSVYDDMIFLSWRDPRIMGTLEDFDNVYDYIENKDISKSDIHQAQISLFSKLDAPVTHHQQLERFVSRLIRGVTNKQVLQKRMYIKKMNTKNLKNTSLKLLSRLPKGVKTVVARNDTTKKIQKEFNTVIKM